MLAGNGPRDFPNILIVVLDCLRADRCPVEGRQNASGCWSRLCKKGVCFTQMISSSTTTPPAFGSLLTGQYPFGHGINTVRGPGLSRGTPTLPIILKEAGYNTYAHVTGPLLDVFGLNAGFDVYEHRDRERSIHTDWGKSLLDRLDAERNKTPWFRLLHFFEIHRPRQLAEGERPPRNREQRYDLAWQQLDEQLGLLLDGVNENTIVVMTADHGECINRRADRTLTGHGHRKLRDLLKLPRRVIDWRNHGFFLFEELVRIPCVICGPGLPKKVVHEQVRQVDLMPTVLDLLGIAKPAPTHGRSLLPFIRGEDVAGAPAYVHSGGKKKLRRWHGLRTEEWKYAEHPHDDENIDPDAMLFDLKSDPNERRNVIRDNQETALRMRKELNELINGGGGETAAVGQELSEQEKEELHRQLKALGYM